MLSFFSACKKSGNDVPINVGGYLESGTWHVASFVNEGQDETAHFSGYTFSFNPSGAVTATDSVVTGSGNWGSGIADGVSTVTVLFQSPFDFQVLNDNWRVQNASETRVSLSDNAGGTASGDQLVLERN
ncbi:hypothetical protein GCM10028786_04860 [Flaviaesturariibacter terrae]